MTRSGPPRKGHGDQKNVARDGSARTRLFPPLARGLARHALPVSGLELRLRRPRQQGELRISFFVEHTKRSGTPGKQKEQAQSIKKRLLTCRALTCLCITIDPKFACCCDLVLSFCQMLNIVVWGSGIWVWVKTRYPT